MRHSLMTCFMIALVAVACGAATSSARAQAASRLEETPRHHEYVRVETDAGRSVRCLVVYPEVDRPTTAVVVIHENRGLTDFEKSVADELAEAGFVAIAPDLLSQTGPNGGDTDAFDSGQAAREGIYRLPADQVTDDVDAVVAHARSLDATTDTVGVAGFCWGGGQSFRYATNNPEIAAAFVFYGSAPEAEDLERIEAPVYGFYGGNDFRITGQVPEIQQQMNELGKAYEPVVYDGAGHGFVRSGAAPDADPANRAAREQAWERWTKLLSEL